MATECPQLDAYQDAIVAQRKLIVTACVGVTSPECDNAQARLSWLGQRIEACKAGEDVPDLHDEPLSAADSQPALPPPPTLLVGYVEIVAGGGVALAYVPWRQSIQPSPSMAIRAGGARGSFGVLGSFEWTNEHLASSPTIFPPSTAIPTLERLRLLGHIFYETRPLHDLSLSVRAGAGIDMLYAGYETTYMTGNQTFEEHVAPDQTSLAFELGVEGWYAITDMIELGGAVSLPAAMHSTTPDIRFSTTVDLSLSLGLRFYRR
jgi:hypothetical protein